MIFVEVTHRKVPYIHDSRYQVTVFDREHGAAASSASSSASASWRSRTSRLAVEWRATTRSICRPRRASGSSTSRTRTCCPPRGWGSFRRLRFRLFVFLRRISRPTYYDYGLGDEVQLSAEIIPVRLR